MLRRHRIGTIAAEQKDTAQAEQYLSHSQQHFSKRLGGDNPITGEVLSALLLSYCFIEMQGTSRTVKRAGRSPLKQCLLAKLRICPGNARVFAPLCMRMRLLT